MGNKRFLECRSTPEPELKSDVYYAYVECDATKRPDGKSVIPVDVPQTVRVGIKVLMTGQVEAKPRKSFSAVPIVVGGSSIMDLSVPDSVLQLSPSFVEAGLQHCEATLSFVCHKPGKADLRLSFYYGNRYLGYLTIRFIAADMSHQR